MLLLPAYSAVITADIAQLFSDCYKDEVGCRPNLSHWTRESMQAWLDRQAEREYYDVEWQSYVDELAAEYYAEQAEMAEAEAQVDEWHIIASEYQDGWL